MAKRPGDWLEIRTRNGWIPFLVTHAAEAGAVHGIALSGVPHIDGLLEAAHPVQRALRGDGIHQWREPDKPKAVPRKRRARVQPVEPASDA